VSVVLSVEQVRDIRTLWRGNSGSRSLYDLSLDFDLDVNELYSVLSSGEREAIGRARSGYKFVSYRPKIKKSKKEVA